MKPARGQSITVFGKPIRYEEYVNSVGYHGSVMDFKIKGIKYVVLLSTEFLGSLRVLINTNAIISVTGQVRTVSKNLIHVKATQIKKG